MKAELDIIHIPILDHMINMITMNHIILVLEREAQVYGKDHQFTVQVECLTQWQDIIHLHIIVHSIITDITIIMQVRVVTTMEDVPIALRQDLTVRKNNRRK